jgi:3-hydroxybutyryl-CoA dehydratase
MLLGGLISAVLGNKLPGPGTIYISQQLNFLAPVHFGDTITACAEVIEIMKSEKRVRMKTTCMNQDGVKVLDGEAVVSPPKVPKG